MISRLTSTSMDILSMWSRTGVRITVFVLLALISVGCVEIYTPGGRSGDRGQSSLSTQLGVQATRIAALETAEAELAADVTRQAGFISYLATHIPATVSTPRLGYPTPFNEFEGNVSIEGGKCCVGGVAGEVLAISVGFRAHSPFADITAMRVVSGQGFLPKDAIEQADWEPFAPTRTFDVTPAINWVGFYVAAQYRDALGNVSRVFRSEISIEGSPGGPTPSPAP